MLQNLAHLRHACPLGLELRACGSEFFDNGGHRTAAGKARTFPQAARLGAIQCHLLVIGHDGAALHDLAGEQIARAHQHTDLHPHGRQRLGQCGHHGRRQRIMDAAGKDHLHRFGPGFGWALHCGMLAQRLQNGGPQHEGRQGPDMTAAFAALDDEAAHALIQIMLYDPRGRGMGEGRNALGLELQDLVDAAARDDGIVRPDPVHRRHLRCQDRS